MTLHVFISCLQRFLYTILLGWLKVLQRSFSIVYLSATPRRVGCHRQGTYDRWIHTPWTTQGKRSFQDSFCFYAKGKLLPQLYLRHERNETSGQQTGVLRQFVFLSSHQLIDQPGCRDSSLPCDPTVFYRILVRPWNPFLLTLVLISLTDLKYSHFGSVVQYKNLLETQSTLSHGRSSQILLSRVSFVRIPFYSAFDLVPCFRRGTPLQGTSNNYVESQNNGFFFKEQ